MKIELSNGKKFDSHEKKIAILPIGSIERHGDFLPLGTDILIPLKLAQDLEKTLPVDIYPPIFYGVSPYFTFAGGTISIDSNIFKLYTENLVKEIIRQGYKVVILLNGHGGNTNILTLICQNVVSSIKKDVKCIVIDWWRDLAPETRETLFKEPGHAGEDETSIMLYLYENYVDEGYLNKKGIKKMEKPIAKYYSRKLYKRLSPHAYTGNPSKASKTKGKIWYNAVLKDLINIIHRIIEDY